MYDKQVSDVAFEVSSEEISDKDISDDEDDDFGPEIIKINNSSVISRNVSYPIHDHEESDSLEVSDRELGLEDLVTPKEQPVDHDNSSKFIFPTAPMKTSSQTSEDREIKDAYTEFPSSQAELYEMLNCLTKKELQSFCDLNDVKNSGEANIKKRVFKHIVHCRGETPNTVVMNHQTSSPESSDLGDIVFSTNKPKAKTLQIPQCVSSK
eukprot:UN32840